MTKVKLVNEDGVIKGIDPRTGETIPIEFEDIKADTIAAGSVENTNYRGRPLWSTENRTIKYGTDVTSPEELIGELPWFLFHDYNVDLSDVSDPDLDLRIPQIHSMTFGAQGLGREDEGLKLQGSNSGVGGPDIGSCYVDGFIGGTFLLKGVTLNKSNPFDDEGAAFVAKNTLRAAARRCKIGSQLEPKENNHTVGFQSYTSRVIIYTCDIGENQVDYGLQAKKGGTIQEQLTEDPPLTGTANEYAYWASGPGGRVWFSSERSTATGGMGLVWTEYGVARDVEKRRLHGVTELVDDGIDDSDAGKFVIKLGGSDEPWKYDAEAVAIFRGDGDLDLAGTVNENAL